MASGAVHPRYLVYITAIGRLLVTCARILLLLRRLSNPFVPYVFMLCRADALVLGVLGAMATRTHVQINGLHNNGRLLLTLLLFLLAGTGLLTKDLRLCLSNSHE